jgi:hypothetical protein
MKNIALAQRRAATTAAATHSDLLREGSGVLDVPNANIGTRVPVEKEAEVRAALKGVNGY